MQFSICIVTNAGLSANAHRRNYLLRLIASLSAAGFTPDNSEIIVTGALFDDIPCTCAVPLPEVAASGKVSALRNAAIKEARGEWIVQCDDDIVFAPGYVTAVNEVLRGDADIVCTRLLNPNGTRFWDWAAFVPGKGQTLLPYNVQDDCVYATGGHALYRRSIFWKLQWPEQIRHGENEEYAFADLARQCGLNFRMCLGAAVYLQYHHCDAHAAVLGRPQTNKELHCAEFNALLESAKLPGDSPERGAAESPERKSLGDRIGHKFGDLPPGPEPLVDVSILICCHRFLQRFRVFATSLCRQNYDLKKVEVIVANPHSPDGLSSYLELLKLSGSSLRFEEVLLDTVHCRNRGLMIQRAFEHSCGRIVIGMDCDLVLPPDFLRVIVEVIARNPTRVVGINRNFLTEKTTAAIVTGRIDPFANFQALKGENQEEVKGFRGILGYCQATTRTAWQQVGYPLEFDEIAKSDVAFVERLTSIGVTPLFLKDMVALHLNHKRNWKGTEEYL